MNCHTKLYEFCMNSITLVSRQEESLEWMFNPYSLLPFLFLCPAKYVILGQWRCLIRITLAKFHRYIQHRDNYIASQRAGTISVWYRSNFICVTNTYFLFILDDNLQSSPLK